mgnify:FL=1
MFRYDNSTVRRRDRLLAPERALELLREGEYGFLAMVSDDERGGAYGLPLSYVWDGGDALYIHCAPEGRKLRCLERSPRVTFCVVGRTRVFPARFTTAYESLLLECRAVRGLDDEERMHALGLLLEKYSPDDREVGMRYAEKSFHRTEVVRLDILGASGKCKVIR